MPTESFEKKVSECYWDARRRASYFQTGQNYEIKTPPTLDSSQKKISLSPVEEVETTHKVSSSTATQATAESSLAGSLDTSASDTPKFSSWRKKAPPQNKDEYRKEYSL